MPPASHLVGSVTAVRYICSHCSSARTSLCFSCTFMQYIWQTAAIQSCTHTIPAHSPLCRYALALQALDSGNIIMANCIVAVYTPLTELSSLLW